MKSPRQTPSFLLCLLFIMGVVTINGCFLFLWLGDDQPVEITDPLPPPFIIIANSNDTQELFSVTTESSLYSSAPFSKSDANSSSRSETTLLSAESMVSDTESSNHEPGPPQLMTLQGFKFCPKEYFDGIKVHPEAFQGVTNKTSREIINDIEKYAKHQYDEVRVNGADLKAVKKAFCFTTSLGNVPFSQQPSSITPTQQLLAEIDPVKYFPSTGFKKADRRDQEGRKKIKAKLGKKVPLHHVDTRHLLISHRTCPLPASQHFSSCFTETRGNLQWLNSF